MQKDNFEAKTFPNLSGLQSSSPAQPLRICIASQEILGPVRNGGIASTYYHLARGLVAQGHQVTIILLWGAKVQQYTTEYWQKHYADLGIDLQYLPWVDEPFDHVSHPWQGRCVSFCQWLEKQPKFDLVHTSEWRGGAYYALAAKRAGIAFQDTLFVVKASSPVIWNRDYQMLPMAHFDLFTVAYAEQKCIEWADMVIGGSAHLLCYMEHMGYRLPADRTFVQPNFVDFDELKIQDKRPPRKIGELIHTKKIVFFGRLDLRKGLLNFCNALDHIVSKGIEIESVSFMGKEGVIYSGENAQKPIEYIHQKAKNWPFPINIITDKGQPEALTFLCSDNYLAVMPSLIENSSMTVYEALIHKIPFLASDVGGTSELIANQYHIHCLMEPNVEQTAEGLSRVLQNGQLVAAAAYNNDENLILWHGFHHYLSQVRTETGSLNSLPVFADDLKSASKDYQHRCVVIVVRGSIEAKSLLERARKIAADTIVWCVADNVGLSQDQTVEVEDKEIVISYANGSAIGCLVNRIVKNYVSELCLLSMIDVELHGSAMKTFAKASAHLPEHILTSFFRLSADDTAENKLGMLVTPWGGNTSLHMIDHRTFGAEVIGFTRATFDRLGDFIEYNVEHGIVHEYVARTLIKKREVTVLPKDLFKTKSNHHPSDSYDERYSYLIAKSTLEVSDLETKKLILLSLNPILSSFKRNG